MRKSIVLTCLILTLLLCSCNKGDISSVKITDVQSEIYTEEDIDSAIDVILEYFHDEFSGCKLNEIEYAGDDMVDSHEEYTERYDADEVIVLLSSFYVDSSGGGGCLNTDQTYDGWGWILVRDEDDKWVHVDHGY